MLNGQIASDVGDPTFARDLSLFSGTLAGPDPDLRKVIDSGSVTATQLRTFLEDNRVELGELINNLVTTGEIVVKHLDGVEQLLVIYPYVVEGGFTVVSKSPGHRPLRRPLRHDPHPDPAGLQPAATRTPTAGSPQDGSDKPMDIDARCAEPAVAEQRPRRAERPARRPRPTARRSWRRTTRPPAGSPGVTRWTRT